MLISRSPAYWVAFTFPNVQLSDIVQWLVYLPVTQVTRVRFPVLELSFAKFFVTDRYTLQKQGQKIALCGTRTHAFREDYDLNVAP
jgi:hypothetical protein